VSGSLEKLLDSLAGTGVPGVAVASAGPGFEWTRAAGVADVESGETLAPEHRFPIASVSKIFTATVVLQLVGEGRLALDGDSGIVEGVTVRQLLNHTSGIPNHFDSLDSWLEPYRVNPRYRPGLTPHTTLELALGRPRLFAPGAGWAYSGTDFLALWLLVEQTTGASLGHELRRRVFEPLGLDATDAAKGSGSSADQVRGYLPADNPLLPGSGPGPVDV